MATATLRKSRAAKFGLATLLSLGLVGALAPAAFAQGSNDSTPSANGRPRPRLTDAQKACLEQQGVKKPAAGANGERPRPTDAQRQAFQAAAKACGIQLPAHPRNGPHRPRLTDAQRSCLEAQGVKNPAAPANGERPTRPTEAQRLAFRAAAKACGITVPDKPPAAAGGSSNSTTNTST